MRVLLLPLLTLLLMLPLPSQAAGFYLREEEGWFWYERDPEPITEEQPAAPRTAPTPAPLAETAPEGPKPLSAKWIREHIGAYLDAAIDDPTPQNVALYLYLQRVALDKSSRFAAATQRAVQLDPFLDEITRRPTATFAANLTNRQAGDNRDSVLRRIAETAGVLFFFRSDCPYCEAQAPLLQLLASRYGFSVLPVSVDGAPLSGGVFPEFRQDRGQAQALGVVSTPALFLARPPDGMVPLSQGLLSLAQLQERVVVAAGNLLKASDLLNGTRDREDAAEHANAWPHRLRLYQCGPAGGPIDRSENGCLNPSVREDTVNGMIQRVKDVLIGVRPYAAGTETLGLVQKFRLGQGAVTAAEQAFMQYAPNGLGAGIRTLARYDEGMARLFVEQAAALNAHAYAKQLQTQIAHAREQLFREYAVLDDRYGNPQTLLAYYQGLVEEIKGRRYFAAEQAHAASLTQQ